MSFAEKYQAGESYGDDPRKENASLLTDPLKLAKDILSDYTGVRKEIGLVELSGMIKELLHKGEPLDDKKG